jgi:hypothetical protein
MNYSAATSSARMNVRYRNEVLVALIGLFALAGAFWADSPDYLFSYLAVALPAVAPAVIWIRANTPGVPIFPVVSSLYIPTYALAVLRSDVGGYESWETLRATATIGCFLISASISWYPWVFWRVRQRSPAPNPGLEQRAIKLMFAGLLIGALFYMVRSSGSLPLLESWLGLVRQVAITAASIACYLVGYARAQGSLQGKAWALSLLALGSLILFELASLFLIGAITYFAAAMAGYIITSRRIPWKTLLSCLVIAATLHNGKWEMRSKYWSANGRLEISISEVPAIVEEWIETSLTAPSAPASVRQDLLERASLLDMVSRVQRLTPDYVPFLGGETYAFLPQMLVPRFVQPDKIESQAGVNLLSVRYGLQTEAATQTTTLSWGLVAEAYANFGYFGVVAIGFIFGSLTGFFSRLSAGRPSISTQMLLSIAALIVLTNVAVDFGYLMTNLCQALVAAAIFGLPLRGTMQENSSANRRPLARSGQRGKI